MFQLAIELILERRKGRESRWHPYVALLPPRPATALLWSQDQLDSTFHEPLKEEVARRRVALRRGFEAVEGAVRTVVGALTWEEFEWATTLVLSHAHNVTDPRPGEAGPERAISALVPWADMINHDLPPRLAMHYGFDRRTGCFEVFADRDYRQGEQVGRLARRALRLHEAALRRANATTWRRPRCF